MKVFVQICIGASLVMAGCGNSSNDKGNDNKEEPVVSDTTATETPQKVEYDYYLTDLAHVIAGLPIEGTDSVLRSIQQTDYYKDYQKFTEETFNEVRSSMLEPVKTWCEDNHVVATKANPTCFYPFSGPDFMFANTFFPTAKTYILLGLERRGSLPYFDKMNDNERKRYFDGLKQSMKYINSRGYFVTQHMGSDYSKAHLNGVVHMILYMMAQTGHKIVAVQDGWINPSGELVRIAENEDNPDSSIRVKCIDFVDAEQTELKTLYFFNKNIEDTHVADSPEMITFLESFPNRVSYLKAAQCAAFNPTFEVVRKLVSESDVVIQDDSGIPYRLLSDTTEFDTKLYGTYNSVISDLSWCLQKDLIKDLKEKGDQTDLPFKISYNGNYGKGIIIYAVRKPKVD